MTDRATRGQRLLGALGFLFLPWAGAAIVFVGGGAAGTAWWRWVLLGLWAAGGVGLWLRLPRSGRWRTPWVLLLISLIGFYGVRPSQDRSWTEDQSRAPWAELEGDEVRFHDVRNFRYSSPSEWEAGWYDATYRLSELEKAYFVVEHFAESEAIAHTLVSFRFAGDRFLAFSVEIRKEEGESYSPVRGLFRQYELLYVVADERDALELRTNHRPSRVRIHPIDGDPERMKSYFLDLVARVNSLAAQPEYYNTLTSSCTTNLAQHLEAVTEHEVTFDKRIYLPGYSSELAWELGLLGEGSFEEVLERDSISPERVEGSRDSEHYSLLIRGEPAPAPPAPDPEPALDPESEPTPSEP